MSQLIHDGTLKVSTAPAIAKAITNSLGILTSATTEDLEGVVGDFATQLITIDAGAPTNKTILATINNVGKFAAQAVVAYEKTHPRTTYAVAIAGAITDAIRDAVKTANPLVADQDKVFAALIKAIQSATPAAADASIADVVNAEKIKTSANNGYQIACLTNPETPSENY